MRIRFLPRLFAGTIGLLAVVLVVLGDEPTSTPTTAASQPAKSKNYVIEPEMPYRAHLRTTGVFINAHHLSGTGQTAQGVVDSLKSKANRPYVAVIICRGPQEETIKTFWDVSDQYIFESLFLKPDWTPPSKDTLIWPGYDHPMINYIRRIRMASMGKPSIVSVPMTCREIWGIPRARPELFDELRWMTMAVIGADYDGILWGHFRCEEQWSNMLNTLAGQLKTHAADLALANPVDWVKAPKGQPVSALASDKKLFITLLNTDFMIISEDKKEIVGALNPGRCQGKLKLNLPPGISVKTATTLDGSLVKLTQVKGGITCPYDFASGGEMIIISITREGTEGTNERSTKPSSRSAGGKTSPQPSKNQ